MARCKTDQKGCPRCRSDQFFTIIDKFTRSKVIQLKVRCENRDCDWEGELLDRPKHISDKCGYTPKKCRYGCGEYYCCKDLPVHEQDECPNRPQEVLIESDRRNKKKLKELEVKCHKQETLLKKIREEEAKTYKMEKTVVEKELRKRGHLYKNHYFLQQKLSNMEQEQSLLQGICNICILYDTRKPNIFILFEGSYNYTF